MLSFYTWDISKALLSHIILFSIERKAINHPPLTDRIKSRLHVPFISGLFKPHHFLWLSQSIFTGTLRSKHTNRYIFIQTRPWPSSNLSSILCLYLSTCLRLIFLLMTRWIAIPYPWSLLYATLLGLVLLECILYFIPKHLFYLEILP